MENGFGVKNIVIACSVTAIVVSIIMGMAGFFVGHAMQPEVELMTEQDAFLRLYDTNGQMTGSYAVSVDEKSDAIYCNLKDGGTVTIEFEK